MKPEYSDLIIKYFASYPSSLFIIYEQINPFDAFGKTMIENLKNRNCPLESIFKYPTLDDQIQRFKNLGYQNVRAKDFLYVYNHILDKKEKERIEKIEMLDEYEEWRLILQHYFVLIAYHGIVEFDLMNKFI